jgi:hypothetical protein
LIRLVALLCFVTACAGSGKQVVRGGDASIDLHVCDGELHPGDASAAIVGDMVVAVSCIEAPATASLDLVSTWAVARAREEILNVTRVTEVDMARDTVRDDAATLEHVSIAASQGVFDGEETVGRAWERSDSLLRMIVRVKMPRSEAEKAVQQ